MALKHVNILDIKTPQGRLIEFNYLSMTIGIAILILSCFLFNFWQQHQFNTIQAKIDLLMTELQSKKEPGKDILSQLKHPIIWSDLLKKVTQIIPSSIQLSQLTGSLSGKRALVLIGNTHSLKSMLLLKQNLSSLSECKNTAFVHLTSSAFQVECQIQ